MLGNWITSQLGCSCLKVGYGLMCSTVSIQTDQTDWGLRASVYTCECVSVYGSMFGCEHMGEGTYGVIVLSECVEDR